MSGIVIARHRSEKETEKFDVDDEDFLAFCSKYNKSYRTPKEYEARKETWKDSDEQVKALNSSGDGSVVFEINATADLEDKEFKAMLGAKSPA